MGIKAQIPIVPMALCGTGDVALKGELKLKKKQIELRIGKPVITTGRTYEDRNAITEKVFHEVKRLKSDCFKQV